MPVVGLPSDICRTFVGRRDRRTIGPEIGRSDRLGERVDRPPEDLAELRWFDTTAAMTTADFNRSIDRFETRAGAFDRLATGRPLPPGEARPGPTGEGASATGAGRERRPAVIRGAPRPGGSEL